MKRVVIGGGLAGVYAAKQLNATLITDSDFVFLPRLPDAISKDLKTRIPVDQLPLDVIQGKVLRVDSQKKQVVLENSKVGYDDLIIAIGASPLAPLPNLDKHAHFFYNQDDVSSLKLLREQNICIVGAGPTGIEIAAELAIHNTVTIVTAGSLLEMYSDKAQKLTRAYLKKHDIKLFEKQRVQHIDQSKVYADKTFSYDHLIWCAGVKANRLEGIPYDRGIPVDKCQQVLPHVYAIGDCTTIKVKNAQSALQQAQTAISNIRGEKKSFTYDEKGKFLLLHNTAILDGPITIKSPLIKWVRSAYYAIQLFQYKR